MINIKNKSDCCGCSACVQSCPKQCISLFLDNEGFLYPKANGAVCINCGLCEKVCPVLSQKEEKKPLETLAALNKNEDIRQKSSSGGVFTLLAENVLKQDGVVFGAKYDEVWGVVIDSADSLEGIESFRGSKYMQARTEDSYRRCKTELDKGRKVLYSGTPCQIAGLHNYLRKPYDNLLSVDFVCHGVPSPEVWKRYLNELVESLQKSIETVNFRDKPEGWRKFHLKIDFNKSNKTYTVSTWYAQDTYMRAFLANMILRPSCYKCPAKCGKSHSDITLADFWGAEKFTPEMDDDKGLSLVMINTEKGQHAFNKELVDSKTIEYESVIPNNPSITTSVRKHSQRDRFFYNWQKKNSVSDYLQTCLEPTMLRKIITYCKYTLLTSKKSVWGG